MKKLLLGLLIGLGLTAGTAYAAPMFNYSRTLVPEANTTYDLGSSTPTRLWNNVFTNNLLVNSQAGTGGCAYFDASGYLLGGATCSGGGGGGSGGGWSTSSPNIISTNWLSTTNALVGINSSTPWAVLTVKGIAGTTTPTFVVASSNNASLLRVASNGSTTLSSLGTGIVRSTSGSLFNGLVGLTSDVSGVLPLANGGIATTTLGNLTVGSDLSVTGGQLVLIGTSTQISLGSNVVTSVVNDTNVTGSIAANALTLGWTGTLAAGRLNSNVVQAITNDTNVTGSISAQNLTLGWTGVLSVARGGIATTTLGNLTVSSSNLSVTGGQQVLIGTSTVITLTDNPTFTKGTFTNASTTNLSVATDTYFKNLTSQNCLGTSASGLLQAGSCTGGSGNSAWTIGNALIYNATSTDAVLIGTSTPITAKLFIQGSAGQLPLRIASSTGTTLFTVDTFGTTTIANLGTGNVRANAGSLFIGPIDISADTNLAAGRSLTLSGDSVEADAELYTHKKTISITSVGASISATTTAAQFELPVAATITEVSCSTDVGTATIQLDERARATPNTAGTDVMTSTLACDTNAQTTTTFSNAGIAADVPVNLDIDSVASSPTRIRIHVTYTNDD